MYSTVLSLTPISFATSGAVCPACSRATISFGSLRIWLLSEPLSQAGVTYVLQVYESTYISFVNRESDSHSGSDERLPFDDIPQCREIGVYFDFLRSVPETLGRH